jgi:hypothetical protein
LFGSLTGEFHRVKRRTNDDDDDDTSQQQEQLRTPSNIPGHGRRTNLHKRQLKMMSDTEKGEEPETAATPAAATADEGADQPQVDMTIGNFQVCFACLGGDLYY